MSLSLSDLVIGFVYIYSFSLLQGTKYLNFLYDSLQLNLERELLLLYSVLSIRMHQEISKTSWGMA
jgi:hypothetical protein